MKKIILFGVFLLGLNFAFAQHNVNCYRVYLHDKAESPYSVQQPELYLSQRCIDKRNRYFIPVTEQDIPVNETYITQILSVSSSMQVLCTSKWMNTVALWCPDTVKMGLVRNMGFVDSVTAVGYYENLAQETLPDSLEVVISGSISEPTADTLDYGVGYNQIAVHNGQMLHAEGFAGEGMLIAMLDAGWLGFDINPYLANLYENGQIWGTYNFVPGQPNVYWKESHGSACASIILTNVKYSDNEGSVSSFVGTAPNANMVFIRTEDGRTEQPIEEDYWIAGAELADSLGADVITSSLGYAEFDDKEAFPRNHSSLNGQSLVSRAASLAAHKGMIVCVAAGNDASKPWHRISRPSDAEDILAVGAMDVNRVPGSFSSYGPSYDNRVKPDVTSVGVNTNVITSFTMEVESPSPDQQWYQLMTFPNAGNGTSYATPCLAGLATCLWQAMPQYTSLEIMEFIREVSHQYETPDSVMGYGIPDFYQAYLDHHQGTSIESRTVVNDLQVYPNPCGHQFNIVNNSNKNQNIQVFDFTGKLVLDTVISKSSKAVISTVNWAKGMYFIQARDENGSLEVKKLICR